MTADPFRYRPPDEPPPDEPDKSDWTMLGVISVLGVLFALWLFGIL